MYELLLYKWYLSPDYIMDNWTDEMLQLMTLKFMKRVEAIQESLPDSRGSSYEGVRRISDISLFNRLGIKVIKA